MAEPTRKAAARLVLNGKWLSSCETPTQSHLVVGQWAGPQRSNRRAKGSSLVSTRLASPRSGSPSHSRPRSRTALNASHKQLPSSHGSCLRFVLASNSPVVAACCLSCFYSSSSSLIPSSSPTPPPPLSNRSTLVVSEVKHLRLLVAQNPGWLVCQLLAAFPFLALPFLSEPLAHLTPCNS